MPTRRAPRRLPGLLAIAALGVPVLLGTMTGCAGAPAASAKATVTVAIASAPHAAEYEVRLQRSGGDFTAVHRMRTGQTRTYAVPAGWLTVRIPGLCVVPTPNTGSTLVQVNSRTCALG